jgi:hypothetical protein
MVALAAGAAMGHWRAGLAVALGLLVGSANGFLAQRTLQAGVGFSFLSLTRLLVLSVVGIGLAALIGIQLAPLTLGGIALAQLALAAAALVAAVRQA